MKIEKIASNKVKITITIDDLSNWDVSIDSIAQNTPQARDMLYDIMRLAERQTGFQAENGRIMVEVMPSTDGIIMFATRIEEEPVYTRKKQRYRVKDSVKTNPIYCYRFLSFEDFVSYAKAFDVEQENTLFLYEGDYFVIAKTPLPGILDFAEKEETNSLTDNIFKEHAQCILYSAVNNIKNYF